MSFLGILVLLALGYAFSKNRKAINWRTVGGAFAIQFGLAAFVLGTSVGGDVLG